MNQNHLLEEAARIKRQADRLYEAINKKRMGDALILSLMMEMNLNKIEKSIRTTIDIQTLINKN